MAYTKQTWTNGAGGGTPLSAARLQYIEDGLEAQGTAVDLKAPLASPTFTGAPTLPTPIINGTPTGTGVATAATASTLPLRDGNANLAADAFMPGSTSITSAAGTTTLTVDSTEIQIVTGSTTQTIVLPTTNVVAGQRYTINNQSTGTLTLQTSNLTTIATMTTAGVTGQTCVVTALIATPTTSAHWSVAQSAPNSIRATVAGNSMTVRDSTANILANSFIPDLTSTVTAAGTTTLLNASDHVQVFTGSTTQTCVLPTTSIVAGQNFLILNPSTGAITVNSSGGNLVKTVAAGASTRCIALQAAPTTAAHWFAT